MAAIGAGILLALLLFAPVVQFTDANDYNIQRVDPASGLPLYYPHTVVHELTGCFENDAWINNLGFHGPDVQLQKSPGVFRIVVVGSSYVEARQVPTEQMFTTLLQQKLNADPHKKYTYEVIPIGFNGNSTLLNDLYYTYYGSPLKPDLVIDMESGYELLLHLDAAPLDQSGHAILAVPPPPRDSIARELLRHSKLLVDIYNRLLVFKSASMSFLQRPLFFMPAPAALAPADAIKAEAERWSIKNPLIDSMAELIRADHTKLLFATFVGGVGEPEGTEAELSKHFTQLAAKDNFAYDNLAPFIRASESSTGKSFTWLPCDGHFSPAGHQFVADALYTYLSEHPALITAQ